MEKMTDGTCSILNDTCPEKNIMDCRYCQLHSVVEDYRDRVYRKQGERWRDGNWKGICPCIPDTVCQCTRLEDKNGKRVFENDILKDNVIYGVVKWDDANARYIIDDREDGYQDYSEWLHECEIIGNILMIRNYWRHSQD